MFYSQYGQDIMVAGLFKNKKFGTFVDVGAYDGIKFSNTYYLESALQWVGLCFEPSKSIFPKLEINRKSKCYNKAISNRIGDADFLDVNGDDFMSGLTDYYRDRIKEQFKDQKNSYAVQTIDLNSILAIHKYYDIDYLSIDTEGSEHIVLEGIDFSKFNIKVISYEMNAKMMDCRNILSGNGYDFLCRLGQDEIFIKDAKSFGEYLEPFYANMTFDNNERENGWKGTMYRRIIN